MSDFIYTIILIMLVLAMTIDVIKDHRQEKKERYKTDFDRDMEFLETVSKKLKNVEMYNSNFDTRTLSLIYEKYELKRRYDVMTLQGYGSDFETKINKIIYDEKYLNEKINKLKEKK